MAEEKKDALAKTGPMGMEPAPDYIPVTVEGTEHISKDDMTIPRLALGQGLSPQRVKGDPKFIEGLELGDLFNNLTGEIYGVGPIEFFIVQGMKPRGVEFIPLKEGGGIKDFSVSMDDPRMEFRDGIDDKGNPARLKPIATKFYDYIIILLPQLEMIALSFKSTGLKVAKNLNSYIMYRKRPVWSGKYSITSAIESGTEGAYGVYRVANAGWLDEETAKFAQEVFDQYKHVDVGERISREGQENGRVAEPVDTENLPVNPPF